MMISVGSMLTKSRWQRQRGVAAVEAVLMMPFLLMLVILTVMTAQMLLIKSKNIASVRNAAWQNSLFGTACQQTAQPSNAGYYGEIRSACGSDSTYTEARLQQLTQNSDTRSFTDTLRSAGDLPAISTATGYAQFQSGAWPAFTMQSSYSVDAAPVWWDNSAIPLGYDRYLQQQLNSHYLLSGSAYFPRVP